MIAITIIICITILLIVAMICYKEYRINNGSNLSRIESKLNSLDIVLRCNDRTLGKQEKDGIDLKKLNEMLDDTLKKETKESLNQWLSEKDADTVTINKGKYQKLCKCSRYMANWVPYFDVCPICGEYNQRGCICANCHIYQMQTYSLTWIAIQNRMSLK